MQITKVIKNNADGSVEAKLLLTEEQTGFLLNFAIEMLVNAGLATLEVETQKEQQETITVGDAPTPEIDNGENPNS